MEALEYLLLFILAPCSQILLIVLLVLGVRWRGRSPLWLPIGRWHRPWHSPSTWRPS